MAMRTRLALCPKHQKGDNSMSPEQFVTATAALDWSTLDDIQTHLGRCGYWDGVPADPALQVLHVQEMLALTNAENWPLFGMLERPDGQRVYKQEAAFTPADYEAITAYWVQHAAYAAQIAHTIMTSYRHSN